MYAGVNFEYGSDIQFLVRNMKDITFTMPTDPPDDATKTAIRIWEKEIDEFVERNSKYHQNKVALYAIIWAQCSPMMKAKLKSENNFDQMDESCDCLSILNAIKGITFRFESQGYIPLCIHMAKMKLYSIKQHNDESISDYYERFRIICDVILHYKGCLGNDPALVYHHLDKIGTKYNTSTCKPGDPLYDDSIKACTSRALGLAFLIGSHNRYVNLLDDLENHFQRGNDQYPADLSAAYNLLTTYVSSKTKPEKKQKPVVPPVLPVASNADESNNMNFLQAPSSQSNERINMSDSSQAQFLMSRLESDNEFSFANWCTTSYLG